MWQATINNIKQGDDKALARCISIVENEANGYEELLCQLQSNSSTKTIGITGPPGAGKSTLTNALINYIIQQQKRVAVICIDPSSPFNYGALLGDRVRMSDWYLNKNVFIRSLASRGSLGGLSHKIIEICDVVKASNFDYIIIETVGVGQSEVEISGLADCTIVTLVPEAGDEIQTMKAGLMEIANIFVVNKADRPEAGTFVKNLKTMLAPAFSNTSTEIKIIPTIATTNTGIAELAAAIDMFFGQRHTNRHKNWLYAKHLHAIISRQKMKDIHQQQLIEEIEKALQSNSLNIYQLAKKYI
jgi:LAO/AO transport system kinase